MTQTQRRPQQDEGFEYPEAKGGFGGPEEKGVYAATLVAIGQPAPSKYPSPAGSDNYPLTCQYTWAIDGYEGYDKYTFINVEARGPRSNLYKSTFALTGMKIDNSSKIRSSELLNLRCQLVFGENQKGDGLTVTDYLPLPRARTVARPAPRPIEPQADTFDDPDNDNVPF